MFRILAIPFGWLMRGCYILVKNYGLALFIFTFIIKLIMLPSSIKQQKSSARMARLAPKREQIMKKYANNREKQNEAMMELYNQEGVSPTGGCGTMIITYLILFAIIEVVYTPMTYISGLDSEKITAASQTVVNYYQMSQAVKNDIPEGFAAAPTISQRLAEGTNLEELLKGYNENLKLDDSVISEMAATFEANPGLDEYFNNESRSQRTIPSCSTPRFPTSATALTTPSSASISANIRAGRAFISSFRYSRSCRRLR